MVARVNLHNMRQDREEGVIGFGARLRGQADVCKIIIKCPGCAIDVIYTDTILRNVLTQCIADAYIQLDLLGNKKQDMTLEQVFKFVKAKESGKRSASTLLDSNSADATSSKTNQMNSKNKHDPCFYCGKQGHGKSAPARTRKHECPAYVHKCEHCNRDHHVESVCRSKNNPKPAPAPPPPPHGCLSPCYSAHY